MRIKLFAGLVAATVTTALATAAPAPAPAPMAPTGPWQVEFADSMCLLSRPYGAAPKQIQLILKPSMIGDKLEIIVATMKALPRAKRSGKVAMAVSGKPVTDTLYFWAYSTANARLVRIGSSEEELRLTDLRDTLSIAADGEIRHVFALPEIARARPVLDTCLDQLRTDYKVTKADLPATAAESLSTLSRIFSTDDYPQDALKNDESGTVGVLLWVEPNGRVSSCQVIEPTDSKALNRATCAILQRRARFTAGKNAAGNAMRAPSTARIHWQLAE